MYGENKAKDKNDKIMVVSFIEKTAQGKSV